MVMLQVSEVAAVVELVVEGQQHQKIHQTGH